MQHILNFYSLFKYLRLREEKFINFGKIVFKKLFTKFKSVSFVVKFIFQNFLANILDASLASTNSSITGCPTSASPSARPTRA
jgi:hypothetical protein